MIDTYDILPVMAFIILCFALVFAVYQCMKSPLPTSEHQIRLRVFALMMASIGWLGGLHGLIYGGTTENIAVASIWITLSTIAIVYLSVSIYILRKQRNYIEINTTGASDTNQWRIRFEYTTSG
jgi:hypothetical protein